MTRTRRQNPTASDVRRIGGQPLDLVIAATWLGYASNVPTVAKPLAEMLRDAIGKADPCGSEPCRVKLSERDAKALADACKAAGRTRTAEEILSAFSAALEPTEPEPDPDEEFNATRHMEELARDGILSPEELADWKASRQRRSEVAGGPEGKAGLFDGG